MRALLALLALLVQALLCGEAAADGAQVKELDPVHVNAMRNPEVRKYQAVLAGLDAFDRHRKLAPAVDKLVFRLSTRAKDESPAPLAIKLVGDDGFHLPVPVGADGRFIVPRSEAAEDARSELELNRRRNLYRARPDIRTPGLPANQRRLGDLRLECKVTVAIAKEEIPFFAVALVNTVLLTSDWCSFFNEKKNARFGFPSDGPVVAAVLREGERSLQLEAKDDSFMVPIGSSEWSDDAIVELSYAAPTETAGETARTAP